MKYQGPKSFRELVERSYEIIKSGFTRKDDLHVIVGGIGRIYVDKGETITEGDSETNSLIDKLFKILFEKSNRSAPHFNKSYEGLIAACNEANILNPRVFGEYNHSLDAVFISPERIVRFIDASRKDPREVKASRDPERITRHIMDLDFLHRFTHEVVHWDFGDTQVNRDFKRHFDAINFDFDKKKAGKFPFRNGSEEPYANGVQTFSMNVEARDRVVEHIDMIKRLGIYDMEEMAAEIGAAFIIPPTHGITSVSGKRVIAQRLIARIRSQGPVDFIKYLKQKEDQAYNEKRVVFDILE